MATTTRNADSVAPTRRARRGVLGLKTDFDMARMWYQKAAEGGDEEEEQ